MTWLPAVCEKEDFPAALAFVENKFVKMHNEDLVNVDKDSVEKHRLILNELNNIFSFTLCRMAGHHLIFMKFSSVQFKHSKHVNYLSLLIH